MQSGEQSVVRRHVARGAHNVTHFIQPEWGARGGLFIRKIKDPIILS
jgi:hypothetical protein